MPSEAKNARRRSPVDVFRYLDYRTFLADFYRAKKRREDVKVALSQGAVFGDPGPLDYQPLYIKVGSASIELRYPCEPNQMGCVRPPRGVQALADLLTFIDTNMATTQCPAFAEP